MDTVQSTDTCVCVFWSGTGDTSDANKVLREFQSHLPLNSEKLDKPTKEERMRRERQRDFLGCCGVRGSPRQAACWLLWPSARRTWHGSKAAGIWGGAVPPACIVLGVVTVASLVTLCHTTRTPQDGDGAQPSRSGAGAAVPLSGVPGRWEDAGREEMSARRGRGWCLWRRAGEVGGLHPFQGAAGPRKGSHPHRRAPPRSAETC